MATEMSNKIIVLPVFSCCKITNETLWSILRNFIGENFLKRRNSDSSVIPHINKPAQRGPEQLAMVTQCGIGKAEKSISCLGLFYSAVSNLSRRLM